MPDNLDYLISEISDLGSTADIFFGLTKTAGVSCTDAASCLATNSFLSSNNGYFQWGNYWTRDVNFATPPLDERRYAILKADGGVGALLPTGTGQAICECDIGKFIIIISTNLCLVYCSTPLLTKLQK